jgi:Peptidase S46
MNKIATVLGVLLMLPLFARADEGMWTYNNFPKDQLKQKHGVTVDQAWLDHLQLASARITQPVGCSASFVSAEGLVMTNHHCAHACIEELSSGEKDLVRDGFYAKTVAEEPKCPGMEVNELIEITTVTDQIRKATAGLTDQKYNEAEKAEMSRIEKECATSAGLRCDVVSLYRGGVYDLYKYRRFQDVRLVFAPEFQVAFFGGDPDNFNFPRYDLDVAFVRVWQDEKPAPMDHYLRWSAAGAKAGEVTFVSGHPGGTSRQLTVSQLEYTRDVDLPDRMLRLAELRGLLTEYQRRGPEQKRHSTDTLFTAENFYKAYRGREGALVDKAFFATLVEREQKLREAVAKNPEWQKTYGGLWDATARANEVQRGIRDRYNYLEVGRGFTSTLFGYARTLVRAAEERGKPLETRFREYRDSALPAVQQQLFSSAPIYDEFEIETLTFGLTKIREVLGADDPFVRKTLGTESPEDLATRLVKETRLKDVETRKALWEGGAAATLASKDPLILFAKAVDSDARAIRKRYEDEVEAPLKRNGELLARLRFELYGTSMYPDATFTLRLNFGTVRGWEEPGKTVTPVTVIGGAYDRATGREPFALPPSWLKAKGSLALDTPFNFASDNDIIGGNSGSPVVNAKAEVVGLIFDGNIHSLGGDYGFDLTKNRAVSVHSAALLEALAKIYGADRLVQELRPPASGKSGRPAKASPKKH